MQSLLFLSYLPESWKTLVITLNNPMLDGKLTMVMVKDAIFNEDAKRKDMGTYQTHAIRREIEEDHKENNKKVAKANEETEAKAGEDHLMVGNHHLHAITVESGAI